MVSQHSRFGSELGDRNESFETVREFDHDAAVEHTDDLALHFGIDRERCINAVPRIFGEVLHGEGNATLFLVHGENDEIVPVAQGRRLAATAGERGRFVMVTPDDHDVPWNWSAFGATLMQFYRETGEAPATHDG